MKPSYRPLLLPVFLLSACFLTLVNSKKECSVSKKLSNSKLICYYGDLRDIDGCYCTHVILPPTADVKSLERVRERAKGVKVYVSVNEFNQGLIDLLKSTKVDGLEINLKKLDSKNDISDFISTIKSKIGSDLDIVVSVPSKSDVVAKYFDFKALSKYADLFVLQTAFLGASTNVTFHPSRLSGMWDMQNTDSVVDLISGLGAPLSKLVIAAPVQAFQFTLQNAEYTAPGSPALELKSITRDELCNLMHGGKNWTLERDEDQAGPYIFRKKHWIAFEDSKSIDIKAKYSRIRGLAGIALKDLAQDGGVDCGSTILEETYNGLSKQARAPRGAVLHSLEREILESPSKPFDSVQLSPYRISRIIDTEGKIHVTRQDTRTEFQCSRQGYFVHPRSCNRFYRCVKFDQRSEDFNVFEFDCPAGLAFDERVEVCVWPGSLSHGTPCSGSSEIAPVPRKRFECPSEPGYYADPENCRWFFACLDHGKSPLSAYEFRCPFGLAFDGERLVCEWPWLVPKCASGLGLGLDTEYYYGGGSGSTQYAGQGALLPGAILQNYDGLGTLGAVQLGGISGTLKKPIATVYSNVDSSASGLGYQNNGGYISGGRLSYKAAQSLENAGLLRVNNGVGYQASGFNEQGTTYTTSDLSNGNANGQYISGSLGSGQSAGIATQHNGAFLINTNGQYDTGSIVDLNSQLQGSGNLHYQGATGQYQDTNLHLAQNNLDATRYTNIHGDISGGNSINTNQYHGVRQDSGSYAFGSSSSGQQDLSQTYGNSYVQIAQNNAYNTGHVTASGESQNDNVAAVQYTIQGAQGSKGATSSQSFGQYHGEGQQVDEYSSQSGGATVLSGNQYSTLEHGGEGVQLVGYASSTEANLGGQNVGYVINQGQSDYINSGQYVSGNSGFNSGSVSTQSFNQYHGQQEVKGSESYNSELGNNINIVGGGYSAVGSLNGIHVSSNGDNSDVKSVSYTSTVSPISVTRYTPVATVSSVPTVTAVPVPGIKTSAGFETFGGGVIANIPDLQYKVKSHADAGFLANISSSFANFVVTSPAPVTQEVVQQTYAQGGGYVYDKPSKTFEESPVNTITISTARPFVSVTTEEPKVYVSSTVKPAIYSTSNPAVSTVTYQQYDTNGGYNYQKPLVAFEEKPQNVVVDTYLPVSTPKPAVFVTEQPQIYVSSTPAPSTVSSYSYSQEQKQNQGAYYHEKQNQGAYYHQNPVIISKFHIGKPQTINNGEYYYQRPTVKFEERPIVVQQPTVVQQPAVVSQYFYNQPSVKQQPIVPLYKQPELLATYTYQPPVHQPIYNQPIQAYTYQNVAKQAVGLTDAKQQVTLVQKPIQTYPYQPSEGASYQYIDLKNSLQEKTQAYEYSKPTIAFENKPQVNVVSTYQYSTPRPVIPVQPAIVTSYYNSGDSNIKTHSIIEEQQSYEYSKPLVSVPQVQYQSSAVVKDTESQGGYVYQKPVVPIIYSTPNPTVAVQPAVVSSYFNIGSSKSQEAVSKEQVHVGYNYPKPIVKFQEQPIIYTTPKPVVSVQPVTPAVVTSYFNIQSSTPKPDVYVQEPVIYSTPSTVQPAVEIQKHEYSYTTPKPVVAVDNSYTYSVSSTLKPAVEVQENFYAKPQVVVERNPAIVTSYFNQQPGKSVVANGYDYPKPSVQFSEQPQVIYNSYDSREPVQEVPFIKKTAYVTGEYQHNNQENFNYQQSSQESYQNSGEFSSNIQFEAKRVQPIVSNFIESSTPQPNIVVEKQQTDYIAKPQVVLEQKPAVVTSYFHQQPSKAVVSNGYDYPKPANQFLEEPQLVYTGYENKQPAQEEPFVKKTAYVTGQYQENTQENYDYQHNSQGSYQQHTGKVIVENYVNPKYESVRHGQQIYQQQNEVAYQPQVVLNYVHSTPKPTFVSTVKTIAAQKLQPVSPAVVTFYDSRLTSTPETYVSSTVVPELNIVSTTSRPLSRFSFSSLDDQYQYNQNLDLQKYTTVEPIRSYLPVTSRIRVTTELPKVSKTKVIESYVAPEVTTLARDYLPVRIRTKAPAQEYLPVEVTTPSQQYIPSRQRVRVTTSTLAPEITTLSREYLPVRSRVSIATTGASLDNQFYQTKRPSVVRVVRPTTVIKTNDAHPLLSAKLGAQCTCVSNKLTLRKKQKIIIVDDDDDQNDDNDNDGYVVDDGAQYAVENYSYEPQKVVDITPAPEIYVKSTSVVPQTYAKKRVKVRPVIKQTYLPVTEVSEVFYKKNTSPPIFVEDSSPSDRKIAKAVRTGLKLVKQAAKEGAQEAFDRYGPGGVRSRSETLQGTVDCQRAGLFRHPTECNKFYACRWDCTKNRFTLHVFNCPVHLTFDNTLGACNWPSQGPACVENTLITSD